MRWRGKTESRMREKKGWTRFLRTNERWGGGGGRQRVGWEKKMAGNSKWGSLSIVLKNPHDIDGVRMDVRPAKYNRLRK